jgi:hypothetical protein
VNVLSEALALERDIFQRPIEIQTISTPPPIKHSTAHAHAPPHAHHRTRMYVTLTIGRAVPDYCRSIHPQQLQMLGDRLRLLHAKLNEIHFAQQKVKALLLKAEPIKGVHNLDSLIKDGRTPIGDLKVTHYMTDTPHNARHARNARHTPHAQRTTRRTQLTFVLCLEKAWVQQSFPPTNPGYAGYPPQPGLQPARTLMAGLLKWYLSLSDSWQALLAQPGPT